MQSFMWIPFDCISRNTAHDKRAVFALRCNIWFQVGRRAAPGRFMSGCGRQKNCVAWSLRESIPLLNGEGVFVVFCYGPDFKAGRSHCSVSNSLSRFLCVMFEVSCLCFVSFCHRSNWCEKKGKHSDYCVWIGGRKQIQNYCLNVIILHPFRSKVFIHYFPDAVRLIALLEQYLLTFFV